MAYSRKDRVRKVFADPESMASPLLVQFVDIYTTDAIYWDPETIVQEIRSDYGVDMPLGNQDRLMAAITHLRTDYFWHDVRFFIPLCNVFSGSEMAVDAVDLADAFECSWGIIEATLIHPPEDPEKPFSDEILNYLNQIMEAEGLVVPVRILDLADPEHRLTAAAAEILSDLPEEFAEAWSFAEDRAKSIHRDIGVRFARLLQQLESLPIENGEVDIQTIRRSSLAA